MTWLVVGLGNPGPTYAGHRHNIGQMVVDELAGRAQERFAAPRGMRSEVARTRIGPAGLGVAGAEAEALLLARPRTYMNESGLPVRALATFHGIGAEQVVVVHDELDLDFGRLRLKIGGGDNGHNGLRSIRAQLGSGEFVRVRVGIGRPPGRQDPARWVLSPFSAAEQRELGIEVGRAADAVEALLTEGLTATQNRFNS